MMVTCFAGIPSFVPVCPSFAVVPISTCFSRSFVTVPRFTV